MKDNIIHPEIGEMQDALNQFSDIINDLRKMNRDNAIAFYNMVGWVRLEGDERRMFFFRPDVDFSMWKKHARLSHGFFSPGNVEFWNWLKGLERGKDYVIVP